MVGKRQSLPGFLYLVRFPPQFVASTLLLREKEGSGKEGWLRSDEARSSSRRGSFGQDSRILSPLHETEVCHPFCH